MCKNHHESTRPGKRLHNELERSTMLLMGQLTISITIFNGFWYVYQRVSIIFPGMGFMDIPLKTHGTGALKLGDVRGK
jgi:hypothetical protein